MNESSLEIKWTFLCPPKNGAAIDGQKGNSNLEFQTASADRQNCNSLMGQMLHHQRRQVIPYLNSYTSSGFDYRGEFFCGAIDGYQGMYGMRC